MHMYSYRIKIASASIERIMFLIRIFIIYAHLDVSTQRFCMQYVKMRIKKRWMETIKSLDVWQAAIMLVASRCFYSIAFNVSSDGSR